MANELIKQEQQLTFSDEQVKLIREQIAPKATKDELQLFLYQAKRTGLDPLTRQIYAIHRWNSQLRREAMTIQVSIDGFRVIAERSGTYAGQSEPEFLEKDGKLIACKITVYRFRGEQRYPAAVGVAYYDEYKQTDKEGNVIGLWLKMPHVMLSKVAEALALRKAYPQDLSGLYTSEEMAQSETKETTFTEFQEVDVIGEVKSKIESCQTIEELVKVFNDNKQLINGTPELLQAKETKKQSFQKVA